MNNLSACTKTSIEMALIAGIAKENPLDPEAGPNYYYRAKSAGLVEYLKDPIAIATWDAIDPATGRLDTMLFFEKNPAAAISLIQADTEVESFYEYNFTQWMDYIRDQWKLRKLVEAADDIKGMSPTEAQDILRKALEVVDSAVPPRDDVRRIGDCLADIDSILSGERPASEIGWSIPWLDRHLQPLHSHELVIVGGRPGGGKSAIMAQIAQAMVGEGRKALFISLEMSTSELLHRLTASKLNFPSIKLQLATPEQGRQYKSTFKRIAEDESLIIRDDLIHLHQIEAEISLAVRMSKADVVFIDYLQLIESDREYSSTRAEQVGSITRRLKMLAKRHRVPVICGSQLNRQTVSEQRQPRLSDLRESGSIEQDADRVLLLHRVEDSTKIIQAKMRNGPIRVLDASFRKELTRFEEVLP